jgi:hypothetical protein
MKHIDQYCRFQPALASLFAHSHSLDKMEKYLQCSLPTILQPHVRVANVRQDVLHLHVDASVWASRVRLLGPRILAAWKQQRDLPPVRRLNIRVRIIRDYTDEAPVLREVSPLNTESCQALSCLAGIVEDKALQLALHKLANSACQANKK